MNKTKTFTIPTKAGTDVIDITSEVSKIVSDSKIKSGIACVFVAGSTASISTIEFEPNAVKDLKRALDKIAPENGDYEHHKTWGDDNGCAHVRACFMGPSRSFPFEDKKLILGTWQQIVLLDFDTKNRERKIIVQIVGK
ncbi:MAG: secondary thiamine-phosphate synthase enzyme YjbQ [Candidatus Aenigmarchaeota archaeon]|nr:secondary thiamine-phosphate synthase enzyme YjbQ [Candidatus Aenigmarchaeota archaeon]